MRTALGVAVGVIVYRHGPESDVPLDKGVAWSRAVGGEPNEGYPDQNSTTGTTPNEVFVGRVAGQDVGYCEETGAERRAAAARGEKVQGARGEKVQGAPGEQAQGARGGQAQAGS